MNYYHHNGGSATPLMMATSGMYTPLGHAGASTDQITSVFPPAGGGNAAIRSSRSNATRGGTNLNRNVVTNNMRGKKFDSPNRKAPSVAMKGAGRTTSKQRLLALSKDAQHPVA